MDDRERIAGDEPTIGKLVGDVISDSGDLIRNLIALAKAELSVSFKAGGLGLGLFAAAGFIMVLAVIMLSVAIAYFVHMTGLDLAWSFLIVFGFYLLVAGLLAFIGFLSVKRVRGPQRSIAQAQEAKAALTHKGAPLQIRD